MSLLPLPSRGALRAGLGLLALAAGGCAAPGDESPEYRVVLYTTSPLVYRGDNIYAAATLYHYVGTDSTPVPNAVLDWEGGGDNVQIFPSPQGYANVAGIRRGYAYITVSAPAYGGQTGAGAVIRVADQVELDTVLPDTVAWAGRLTLRGVRVGNPNDVSVRLNGVTLIPDTLSLVGDASQVESMSYFVPGGATSGILQLTGFGLIAEDSTPITVLPHEQYEPNDQAPTVVAIDTAQPYPAVADPPTPGHPEIRFFDPALLYEAPAAADSITTDWFHFVGPSQLAEPWTFVYRSPAIPRRGAFGVPATVHGLVPVFDAGAYGFDFDAHRLLGRCRGADFEFPVNASVDSVVLSLQALPASGIDFVEYTSNSGTYGLAVSAGYRTPANAVSANTIAPDAFEDNDFCEQADANFALDSLKIDLGAKNFADTLTIDTPFEVDWFRFHVAAAGQVAIHTAARNGFPNSKLDLYLYQQADLAGVDSATDRANAASSLSPTLAPGDYYLVVVNTDGTPTRYGLCIATGGSCAQVPEPARFPAGARRR